MAALALRRQAKPVAETYRALVRWLYGGAQARDLIALAGLHDRLPSELALLRQGCAKSRVSAIVTARAMVARLFASSPEGQQLDGQQTSSRAPDSPRRSAVAAGFDALTKSLSLGEALRHISPWPSWHPRGSDPVDVALSENFRVLAEALARVPELIEVADALGNVEGASRQTLAAASGRGEVVGVTLSGDVAQSLPSDRALLGDDQTEDLFYARAIERRLLCFEERGSTQEPQQASRSGPAILCVDTSGSMRGPLETLAKATLCAIARRLLAEGRAVDVVLFGGRDALARHRFRPGVVDPQALLAVMMTSFYGGTDLDAPLLSALGSRAGALAGADIVLITDGLGRLRPDTIAALRAAQSKGMQLVTTLVGRHGRWLEDLSDVCYVASAHDRGLPSLNAVIG